MPNCDLHESIFRTVLRPPGARRLFLCWSILVCSASCSSTTPYDPFRISESELRSRVQTIALAPLQVSPFLADPAFARSQIEPVAATRLTAGGFAVVPSAEIERLWKSFAADVGDLFDPETGRVEAERWEAVEAAVYRDLQSEHGVDAVLYLGIASVDLHLPTANAVYCGTEDSLYWPNWNLEFVDSTQAKRTTTLARALCLTATLYDMEERQIYAIRSGLEMIETYAMQTRARRPIEERLRDPERLQQAIEATLGPLADATTDF